MRGQARGRLSVGLSGKPLAEGRWVRDSARRCLKRVSAVRVGVSAGMRVGVSSEVWAGDALRRRWAKSLVFLALRLRQAVGCPARCQPLRKRQWTSQRLCRLLSITSSWDARVAGLSVPECAEGRSLGDVMLGLRGGAVW